MRYTPPPRIKAWLTAREVAARLGCSYRTAQRIISALPAHYQRRERYPGGYRLLGYIGALPHTTPGRGNPRFKESEFQSELASRTRIRRK